MGIPKSTFSINFFIFSVLIEGGETENTENIKKAFDLSRVRVEEEARYLGIKGKDIENYQKILSYLIVQNPLKKLYLSICFSYSTIK